MSLNKIQYTDNVTVIGASNLNDIQDEIIDIRTAGDAVRGQITDLKEDLATITKLEEKFTGYGVNLHGEEYSALIISGNILQNAMIKKCKKNLFNASEYSNTSDYISNTVKSYQPFLPIFVKPNTTYKVTYTVTNRTLYNNTTWSDRQWVSNDPNTLSGIDSSLFASVDTKTVNITTNNQGCLYFVNVWNRQAMLDAFFSCFTVMIVENNVYADYSTYEPYDGEDISFKPHVSVDDYENIIIHREKTDEDLQEALPTATITWNVFTVDIDEQLQTEEAKTSTAIAEAVAKSQIIPLFVDTIADYNWVSGYGITAFSAGDSTYADGTTDGNNGYFAVTGSEGDNYVTVGSGGNADLSVMNATDKSRWLGGILINDDGDAKPVNFFYKSENELYVYPPLEENITNGQLGNIQTGIHLSKRGYRGYAQHLWGINPKHCEKSKYIAKYRVGDDIPFTVYGGRIGTRVDTRNVPQQYQSKYAQQDYIFNMDWGSSLWHNTESGLEWEVNITNKQGYFELYIGNSGVGESDPTINSSGSAYDFNYASGAEIHCDMYVDNVLVDSYVKTSKKLERICLDYSEGTTAKVKIYSNQWQETNHGFSVGAMTWWINERWTDETENPYLYKAITMLMDSWGDFQNQEVENEIIDLHQKAIGTPVPINNKSGRGMTSQWGRLWFYENVQEHNATIMLTDFGINDFNSSNTTFSDETAPDGSTWPVHFTQATYAESMSKLIKMAIKNNIQPIIMSIGRRDNANGNSTYSWIQAAIDAQAEQVS